MGQLLRVLVLQDMKEDAELLIEHLRSGGFDIVYERVDHAEAMSEALSHQSWDVILSDYSMPRFGVHEALSLLKEKELDLPFIIVSGTIGEDTAVASMKAGAHDFMTKDNMHRLIPA